MSVPVQTVLISTYNIKHATKIFKHIPRLSLRQHSLGIPLIDIIYKLLVITH